MATDATGGKIPENKNLQGPLPLALPLEYLEKITYGFSDELKLSEDAFGTLYKVWSCHNISPSRTHSWWYQYMTMCMWGLKQGILEDGQVIAVKKLANNTVIPAGQQFTKEVRNLMLVHHKNLLNLISCCSEAKEKVLQQNDTNIIIEAQECVLCYEYAPKGSLVKYLSGTIMCGQHIFLSINCFFVYIHHTVWFMSMNCY